MSSYRPVLQCIFVHPKTEELLNACLLVCFLSFQDEGSPSTMKLKNSQIQKKKKMNLSLYFWPPIINLTFKRHERRKEPSPSREVICQANLIKENKNLRKYSFVNTTVLKLRLLRKKKRNLRNYTVMALGVFWSFSNLF